jgi:hypothetical protein
MESLLTYSYYLIKLYIFATFFFALFYDSLHITASTEGLLSCSHSRVGVGCEGSYCHSRLSARANSRQKYEVVVNTYVEAW